LLEIVGFAGFGCLYNLYRGFKRRHRSPTTPVDSSETPPE
jgi:hypothetical protein